MVILEGVVQLRHKLRIMEIADVFVRPAVCGHTVNLPVYSASLVRLRADDKDWDSVIANLDVYRFSGQAVVKEDPSRNDKYRAQVVDELGFGKESSRTDMTADDRAMLADVLWTKAAAFWVEDTPRTVLRHLMHDTIPT